MSKQHNIRWRRSDYSKLSHTIRKFNKKAFGVQVGRPDLQDVAPDLLDYQTVKAEIKTRADFNRMINKYNRYLKEGAEELVKSERGAKASKWDVEEFNIAQRVENMKRAKRKKKIEQIEVTQAGKGTGKTRAEMGSIKENAVKSSKKNYKKMSQMEWEEAKKLFDAKLHSSYDEESKQKMKRNYILGLIREGYSDDLIKIVSTIDLDKFVEVVDTDVYASFDFIYDPLELKAKEEQLAELWTQHEQEESNIDTYEIKEQVYNEIFNPKE